MKRRVRMAIFWLLRATGVIALWRYRRRHEVAILMFHGVMDGEEGSDWTPLRPRVSRARLEQYLSALARHYRFVSLAEAVEMIEGRRPLVPYSLALSFDDGYRNNLTHALPVARRFGAPVALFVSSGKITARDLFSFDRLDYVLQRCPGDRLAVRIGNVTADMPLRPRAALVQAFFDLRQSLKTRLGADLEFAPPLLEFIRAREVDTGGSLEERKELDDWAALLTWDELAALAANPLVEIGSHSVDHTRLGLADDAAVRDQLAGSKREIEAQIGRRCRSLAYPNGSHSASVVEAAREAGYSCGLTTIEGLNPVGRDALALRRIPVPVDADAASFLAAVAGLTPDLMALKARMAALLAPRRAASSAEAHGPL